MTSVFISYSHQDEDLRNQLEKHLAMLKREGLIDVWHDRRIAPGDDFERAISDALEGAHVILLLVSSDFISSEYCYSNEMLRAMARHEAGNAVVLPVILRACDWHKAPFGRLLATPPDGKPVRKWPDIDEAFLHVVKDVRRSLEAFVPKRAAAPRPAASGAAVETGARSGPRSSNLRVRKKFTEADKDQFLDEAFDYIAKFFENSLEELQKRNPDIRAAFKRLDAHRFTAVVYRDGSAQSRCKVTLKGPSGGISYSTSDSASDNSWNDSMHVEEGEQMLSLKGFGGLSMWRTGRDAEEGQLTYQGAAEYYWNVFIEPLQR